MAQTLISIGLPYEVLELVDIERGDIARSLFLRKLITEEIYKRLDKSLINLKKDPA